MNADPGAEGEAAIPDDRASAIDGLRPSMRTPITIRQAVIERALATPDAEEVEAHDGKISVREGVMS